MILTILKIIGIYCVSLFSTDTVMQAISYSFYKGDRNLNDVRYIPEEIQINDSLSGYGYNLQKNFMIMPELNILIATFI